MTQTIPADKAQTLIARSMSEQLLTGYVVKLAQALGYRVAHFRPARTAHGWRTAMQGDVGFPDLVIAGHGRLLAAELKVIGGKLTPDQSRWLAAFEAGGAAAYVWRPSDWLSGEVERVLRLEAGRADGRARAGL
jgi:hypothetical protein